MTPRPARIPFKILLLAAWVLAASFGFYRLHVYAKTPGIENASAEAWPAESPLRRESGKATLLAFLHTECPCSRATIAELERLMPALKGKVEVRLVFYTPKGLLVDDSQLRSRVANLPGAEIFQDEGGREADRFGAVTSGQIYLYGKDGSLVFHGGITPSRGHEGDSKGKQAILAYLEGTASRTTASVFGCVMRSK